MPEKLDLRKKKDLVLDKAGGFVYNKKAWRGFCAVPAGLAGMCDKISPSPLISFAGMAKLAYALDLGSSASLLAGSSPVTRTISSVHNESDEHSIFFCLSFQIFGCLYAKLSVPYGSTIFRLNISFQHEVFKRYTIKILAYHILKLGPHWQGSAFVAFFAG